MTTPIALAMLAVFVPLLETAVGRRSQTPLPKLGPPLRSPHLAPAASAKPSRESRAGQRSGKRVDSRT